MAGLGSFATTTIITNGLHCGSACKGLITGPLSLYCTTVIVPPVSIGGGGGGGGPYPPSGAWNQVPDIQNFYTPTTEQPYAIPREQEADYFRKHTNITISVNIGEIKIEKVYRVPEQRKQVVVKIFNLINVTQSRMLVTVKQLKTVATRAMVTIKAIRLRK